MSEATTIGLDIAKHVFHAHGADECGGAHHWACELGAMGNEVRLIPPAYLKRHKNDAEDAEAICKAAQRPRMARPYRSLKPPLGGAGMHGNVLNRRRLFLSVREDTFFAR